MSAARRGRLSGVLIGCLFLCSTAWAQQTQTGSVSGTVTHDGKPLPGIVVQATADVLPKPRTTVTGASGEYRLPALPPGGYELSFSLSGFASEKRTRISTESADEERIRVFHGNSRPTHLP